MLNRRGHHLLAPTWLRAAVKSILFVRYPTIKNSSARDMQWQGLNQASHLIDNDHGAANGAHVEIIAKAFAV